MLARFPSACDSFWVWLFAVSRFLFGFTLCADDMRQAASSARQALVIKEPRLSLTYPFWHDVVDRSAVCVLIYRHPYLVATGLRKRPRNRGMLLDEWLALWEKYTVGTFKVSGARGCRLCERQRRPARIVVPFLYRTTAWPRVRWPLSSSCTTTSERWAWR